MGTSEGKLRTPASTSSGVSGAARVAPTKTAAAPLPPNARWDPLRGTKRRVPVVPSLILSPSRAELFDFRYLLGRSSARIALFEIETLSVDASTTPQELAERFWRSDSRFVDGNETFCSAYGFATVDDCIGRPFPYFFPPTDQHRTFISQWCQEGLVLKHFDLESRELDGSRKFFSAALYAVDERSAVSRFWIVLRDVTPLANALGAVSQQEHYYRSLVETGGFFLLRWDAHGALLYASPSLGALLGFTAEDFKNNPGLYRSMIHPEDLDAHDQILSARLGDAGKTTEAEYRLLCKDGTYRWMFERQRRSDNSHDPRLASGSYYDSLVFDIHERKLLESELRHSQRMEMVGQLAGGVAHDFNNYLTAILGQIRLSLIELPRDSVTYRRLIDTEQATLRCAEMTKQLLSLAHRDALQKKPIAVERLVTSTASLCSHLLPSNICLSIQHSVADLMVEGDAGQLQQVLMNLIVNARDAITAPGSISVAAQARTLLPSTSILGLPPGDYVQFSIIDSGSGIAPDSLAHIFEPFFTTKAAGSGTGLGLSLVYSIVRNHGGAIGVHSTCGVGSEFYFLLPLYHRGETLAVPDVKEDDATLVPSSLRLDPSEEELEQLDQEDVAVLVVDDEPLVRSVIKASLLGSGYLVSEAHNGEEALAILEQDPNRFALVVIDQNMPRMSGKELVREIRRRGMSLPLLLTTGLPTFDGVPDEPDDAHEVIVKPFDPIDLIGAAYRLCQRRHRSRP